jgi:hypothetical protein
MSNVLSIPNSCRGREQHQSALDVGELRRDKEDISYSFCDMKKILQKRTGFDVRVAAHDFLKILS